MTFLVANIFHSRFSLYDSITGTWSRPFFSLADIYVLLLPIKPPSPTQAWAAKVLSEASSVSYHFCFWLNLLARRRRVDPKWKKARMAEHKMTTRWAAIFFLAH